MKQTALLLVKAAYSNQAMRSLYNIRKALAPEAENRNRLSMSIAAVTLLFLMGFLVTMTFVRNDPKERLQSRGHLILPEAAHVKWSQDLDTFVIPKADSESPPPVALSVSLQPEAFASLLNNDEVFVVVLPSFNFKTLDVSVNGRHAGHFINGGTAHVHVERKLLDSAPGINISLALTPNVGQELLIQRTYPEPLFITHARGFNDYISSRAVANAGRGGFAGLMARIVMAAFVLVLFLFVDGSPESLGMALFLGFEALALTTSFGWLPRAYDGFIVHYLSQMGDVFRLYFFLQLARLIDKRLGPWFWWGTALSVPYGLVRHFEVTLGFQSLGLIPLWRDIIIGFAGAFICCRAASAIAGQGLPWRVIALLIAAIGSFQQVVGPVGSLFPGLSTSPVFASASDIFAPLSVYLLLLSVFVNISTLEKRVKSLSQVAISAKEMEREMVLGQAVQRSFLRVPAIPENLGLVCHHEPALYVSGDIYYVHWDAKREVLSMLLSDITGHGVQAALKAAVCLTLAEALWVGNEVRKDEALESRLPLYDKRVCSFLTKIANQPESLAMLGMEYDQQRSMLTLYRSNGIFPLLIAEGVTTSGQKRWQARTLVVPNQQTYQVPVTSECCLVFLSDGYVGRSRTQFHLQNFLNDKLALLPDAPDAETVKGLLQGFDGYDDSHDDRTLLVFRAPKLVAKAKAA